MLKVVLSTCAGTVLIVLMLADVFLTVLYARVHAGFIANTVSSVNYEVFRKLSRIVSKKRLFLSFAGPVSLVLLVVVWVSLLILGSALLVWPLLGTGFVASQGKTPTSFITAVYMAGDAVSTAGASDITPRTTTARLFFMLTSLMGLSVLTLTITYFLEIYSALQQRNTFAIKLHGATGETGDAAELLAGLMPQGEVQFGSALLSEMAAEMTHFEEAHHFYPVMFYFDFQRPYYATSRVLLLCLDLVALIKTCLNDEEYGWMKESVPVSQLARSSRRMLEMISDTYLGGGMPQTPEHIDDASRGLWLRRQHRAIARLQDADVPVSENLNLAEENYITIRREWDGKLRALAQHCDHDFATIDRWGQDPDKALSRPDFHDRKFKPE